MKKIVITLILALGWLASPSSAADKNPSQLLERALYLEQTKGDLPGAIDVYEELIEYFIHNEGRALTRDQILRHVWGNSIIVTTRSVDRCVTTLRAKIEDNSRHPRHIHTIREIGYRFES